MIDIIDSYARLPMGSYGDIIKIDRTEGMDVDDKQVKIISILTGMDEMDILNLPIPEYRLLAARSQFIYAAPTSPSRIAKSYRIGGYELIPTTDMRKVTAAQYIDFQSFHNAGMEEHFAEIISCILIPKGKIYQQGYDVLEIHKAIREEMTVLVGCSLYAFFLHSCKKSMKDILSSSLRDVRRMKDKEKARVLKTEIRQQLMALSSDGAGLPM